LLSKDSKKRKGDFMPPPQISFLVEDLNPSSSSPKELY
tara:strand:- start:701 stop:814 length:114 start_codon:yes stop_codon:yes gene_type:complete